MKNRKNIIIFLILILIAFAISVGKRYQQYNYWKNHKDIYFFKNTPMMTTLDAYYWLRYGKYVKNGTYSDNDTLRAYPNGKEAPSLPPMLSWIIGKLSKISKNDVYHVGIYLIPILSSLFIIPFGIYFFLNGFSAGGIIGSLIGTFSYAYYVRSCIGRVDTDSLNLFFPFLASLLIFLAASTKDKKYTYIYSGSAGISMLLYTWWYSHPGLILIYFIFLALTLFINKIDKKTIGISLLLFIIFSNPIVFIDSFKNIFYFFSSYGAVKESSNIAGISLPDIKKTITETMHQSFTENLKFLFGIPFLAFIGLIGFIVGAGLKWKKFIPILPMFFLGLLVFKSSNRFAMFLAPFAGAGLGIIIDYIINYASKFFTIKDFVKIASQGFIGLVIFFLLSGKTAYSFIPGPSIPVDIYRSFYVMKKIMPKNSAIFTWWDFGYALMDVTGKATFHDGGVHGGWRTYFVARGLVKSSQKELYNIISTFDNNELKKLINSVKKKGNIKEMDEFLKNYNKSVKNDNIYIVFTRDMIGKFGAMNFFGNWNFSNKKGYFNGFGEIKCSGYSKGMLMCGRANINIEQATLNNSPLNKLLIINNGKVLKEISNDNFAKYYVEILMINNRIFKVYIIDKSVFESNFNQMYILGKYDKKLFREVLYYFPSVRIFKTKKIAPKMGMKKN